MKNFDRRVDIHNLQINIEGFHNDLLIRGKNLGNLHQINHIIILELQYIWDLVNHALRVFMFYHFDAHFISYKWRNPLNVAICQNVMFDYRLDILLDKIKDNLRKG